MVALHDGITNSSKALSRKLTQPRYHHAKRLQMPANRPHLRIIVAPCRESLNCPLFPAIPKVYHFSMMDITYATEKSWLKHEFCGKINIYSKNNLYS